MASGDIDDHFGSEEEFKRLFVHYPELDELIQRVPTINRDYLIPYGAGASTDGQTVYISKDIDTFYVGFDVTDALCAHEISEWAIREVTGFPYEKCHRFANLAERSVVEDLGLTWEQYSSFIDPQVRRDESESIGPLPPDLATYPYTGTLLQKVKEAMDARQDRTETD